MCLIIYGPKEVDESIFRTAHNLNPDGIGMMWSHHKKLKIWKGSEFNNFYQLYKKLISKGTYPAVHFRLATVGSINFNNMHPFKVGSGIGMMHNGTFNIPDIPEGISDTRFFAENLSEFEWNQLKTMNNPIYSGTVNGSRILFMNHLGQVFIVNEYHYLTTERDGVWYSKNNVFKKHLVAVYGTLKRRKSNCFLLENAIKVGNDRIPGWDMYTNNSFPAIAQGEGEISTEIYRIDDEELKDLDHLEGYPHHYDRKQVDTKFGKSWIYFYRTRPNWKKIKTGNF